MKTYSLLLTGPATVYLYAVPTDQMNMNKTTKYGHYFRN